MLATHSDNINKNIFIQPFFLELQKNVNDRLVDYQRLVYRAQHLNLFVYHRESGPADIECKQA